MKKGFFAGPIEYVDELLKTTKDSDNWNKVQKQSNSVNEQTGAQCKTD